MALQSVTTVAEPTVANGTATYNFPAISQGLGGAFSISVPGSAAGVTWFVSVGGIVQGAAAGSASYGPVYVPPGQSISLSGAPPNPSTYTATAVITGVIGPPDEVITTTPPQSGGSPGSTITFLGSISPGNTTLVVTPNPTATQLLVQGAESTVSVTGVTSGDALIRSGGGYQLAFPLPGSEADQTSGYQVELSLTQVSEVDVYQSTVPILSVSATGVAQVVPVSNPSVGADWAVAINNPVRLLVVTATFTASATAASRYPNFVMSISGGIDFVMSPAAITAGQALVMTGAPNLGSPFARSGDTRAIFPIPDVMSPAMTTFETSTENIQSGDQWSNIVLWFANL